MRVVEVLVLAQDDRQRRWFQIRVRSSSSRRQLPIQRSMIEFIRGAWTAERMTLAPAAWKTASNAAVKLADRGGEEVQRQDPPAPATAVASARAR